MRIASRTRTPAAMRCTSGGCSTSIAVRTLNSVPLGKRGLPLRCEDLAAHLADSRFQATPTQVFCEPCRPRNGKFLTCVTAAGTEAIETFMVENDINSTERDNLLHLLISKGAELAGGAAGPAVGTVIGSLLEVWPESHWPGFAPRQADGL